MVGRDRIGAAFGYKHASPSCSSLQMFCTGLIGNDIGQLYQAVITSGFTQGHSHLIGSIGIFGKRKQLTRRHIIGIIAVRSKCKVLVSHIAFQIPVVHPFIIIFQNRILNERLRMSVHIQEPADSRIGTQQHLDNAVCMGIIIHKRNHIRILFLYGIQHFLKLIQIVDYRGTYCLINIIPYHQSCSLINGLGILLHIIIRRIPAHNGIHIPVIGRIHQP